jgi:hypothetical protein
MKKIINQTKPELMREAKQIPDHIASQMSIPENYFVDFASNMLEIAKMDDFINSLPKALPYSVPEQYFTGLSNTLSATIPVAVFLDGMPRHNPYSVPEHYFETLSKEVSRICDPKPGPNRIFRLSRKRFKNYRLRQAFYYF